MVFTTLSTSNNKQRAFVTRDLTLLRRNTASLISMFVVPPLFLLCLVAVFGYSSDKIGFDYVGFILAGCLFQAAMFTAAASSMAVAIDIDAGLVERVRVLPGSVGGFLVGRLITDAIRMAGSTLTLFGTAWLCGLNITWEKVGWTVLWSMIIACALSLVTDGCVLWARRPVELASVIQSLEMLLLMFSTAFIPATSVSGTLRDVVVHMPFSPLIGLIRTGNPTDLATKDAWEAFAWLVTITILGITLTIRRFSARRDS